MTGLCLSGSIIDAGSNMLSVAPFCQARAVVSVYILEHMHENGCTCRFRRRAFNHVQREVG